MHGRAYTRRPSPPGRPHGPRSTDSNAQPVQPPERWRVGCGRRPRTTSDRDGDATAAQKPMPNLPLPQSARHAPARPQTTNAAGPTLAPAALILRPAGSTDEDAAVKPCRRRRIRRDLGATEAVHDSQPRLELGPAPTPRRPARRCCDPPCRRGPRKRTTRPSPGSSSRERVELQQRLAVVVPSKTRRAVGCPAVRADDDVGIWSPFTSPAAT